MFINRITVVISVMALAMLACSTLSTPVTGSSKSPEIPQEVDQSLIPGIGFTDGGQYFTRKAGGWLVSADLSDKGEEHFNLYIRLNGPDAQSISFPISDIGCSEIRGQKFILQVVNLIDGTWKINPCPQ